MRIGHFAELFVGLRQRDIQHRFTQPRPFDEELERQRRLSRSWYAFAQIESMRRETTGQDIVQPGNSCGSFACGSVGKGRRHLISRFSLLGESGTISIMFSAGKISKMGTPSPE